MIRRGVILWKIQVPKKSIDEGRTRPKERKVEVKETRRVRRPVSLKDELFSLNEADKHR